jgi:hypothetical protein
VRPGIGIVLERATDAEHLVKGVVHGAAAAACQHQRPVDVEEKQFQISLVAREPAGPTASRLQLAGRRVEREDLPAAAVANARRPSDYHGVPRAFESAAISRPNATAPAGTSARRHRSTAGAAASARAVGNAPSRRSRA